MPDIQLQDGTKLSFQNTPTPEDVDFAVSHLNQQQQQQPSEQQQVVNNAPNVSSNMNAFDTSQMETPSNLLNFGDHAKLSFLDPQGQFDYLKSKYKYVEPDGKGNLLYGNQPDNLQPVNQEGITNDFVAKLGNLVSSIPSIAGQIALTVGTDGLALPALAGRAAVGSGGGQLLSNLIGAKMQGRIDPEKIAVDTAISAAFGAGGTAASELLAGGAKAIAVKAGSALDNYRNGIILSGKTPNNFDKAVATALHITTGLDKNTIQTGQSLGWRNIFSSPEAKDPHGMASIAEGISSAFDSQEKLAGATIDSAEQALYKKNPNATVGTTNILENVTDRLQSMKILDKVPASEGGQEGMSSSFKFRNDLPSDVKLTDVKGFLKRLGAVESDGGVFHIPENSTIGLDDAVAAKKLYQGTFNNPNFNPQIAGIAKTALYGEGPSVQFPKGFMGLRGEINDTAQASGNDAYIIANQNFTRLQEASELMQKYGMDVSNPANVANWMKNINQKSQFEMQAIKNLESQIGGNITTRAQAWAVNNRISNVSPNFLRLGMVASLFGAGVLDPTGSGKAGKFSAAGLLGTPIGLRILLKGAGGGTSSVLASTASVASKSAKLLANKKSQAILSQLLKNRVTNK